LRENAIVRSASKGTLMKWIIAAGFILFIFVALSPALASQSLEIHNLSIYGNANMDEDLNEADILYVQDIINGNKPSTKLADANFDGKIDSLDIDQIKSILNGNNTQITICDAQNRNVTLNVPVQQIVGVNVGAIEIMRAIGVDIEKAVPIASSYATANKLYFPELQGKMSNTYGSPDYEQIAQTKPDLVILYESPKKDESFDKFDAIKVPVICLDCFDHRTLESDIKILGELFHKRENAEQLVQWYNKNIELVTERTAGLKDSEKPRALILGYPDYTYPTFKVRTGSSGDDPMLVNAGGINLAENVESSKGTEEVDAEWIVSQDPDVIIGMILSGEGKTGYSSNDTTIEWMRQFRDKLLNDSAIRATKAGKEGRVFLMWGDFNSGPHHAAGTAFLAKYLHPDLFKDLKPESILKEYFEQWQKVPYRGCYIYPPLNED